MPRFAPPLVRRAGGRRYVVDDPCDRGADAGACGRSRGPFLRSSSLAGRCGPGGADRHDLGKRDPDDGHSARGLEPDRRSGVDGRCASDRPSGVASAPALPVVLFRVRGVHRIDRAAAPGAACDRPGDRDVHSRWRRQRPFGARRDHPTGRWAVADGGCPFERRQGCRRRGHATAGRLHSCVCPGGDTDQSRPAARRARVV
jgi:hypothetical protein